MAVEVDGVRWPTLFGVATAVVMADQIAKALIRAYVPLGEAFTVIPGCFDIVHGRNTGVAFGLFPGHSGVFTVLGFITIPLLLWGYRVMPLTRAGRIAWAAIVGGATGNQIDRMAFGYVSDFIDWYLGTYHWYTFNVADACIVVGATAILALDFLGSGSTATSSRPSSPDATDPL